MKIFAHRGASGDAPQNTIAAIKSAIEQNCDGIEIDVQLTKDNEVVVYHDWDIKTLSNGQGEIGDHTLTELKKLDFGSYFSEDFKDEQIPTLEEVLDIVPDNIILNIELKIKSYNNAPLAKKTAEILKRRDRYKNILISCFDHNKLNEFYEFNNKIQFGLLYAGNIMKPIKYVEECNMNIESFNLHKDYISKELVESLHKHKKKVYLWTINSVEEAKLFMEMGVDGIMTNHPALMKEKLYLK